MKAKFEVVHIFNQFKVVVETQFDRKIKVPQSDWGGEYRNFKHPGIIHQLSCPHTPQQNGLAERRHRQIVQTGPTLLANASRPLSYWDEAFASAVFLINRFPTKSLGMISPLQKVSTRVPDYNFLKVYGCQCFPYLRPYNNHKLKFRSLPCVFIGYSSQHKGYKYLHIPSGRVYVSGHVVFNEDIYPFASAITPTDQPPSSSFVSCPMTSGVLSQSLSCHVSVNSFGLSNTSPLRSSSLLLSTNHRPPIDIFSTSTNPPLNPIDPCPHDVPVLPTQSPIVTSLPTNTSPAPIIASQSPSHYMVTRSQINSLKPRVFQARKHPLQSEMVKPTSYSQAKEIPHWQKAMQAEHLALIKNDT
ncbi:hypothetical protein LIER_24112 [Lithospermum erythrorhizon]|uniref:Integrase catalytic domain-containing protein n=1 Tax=Lithospermum erythrorhizon TaxID=34254 RepID=A0AAV3R400_LITER